MARHKNKNWNCGDGNNAESVHHANLAVLMDIRDELQELNATLNCYRFQGLPSALDRIDRRLQKNGLLLNKPKRKQA